MCGLFDRSVFVMASFLVVGQLLNGGTLEGAEPPPPVAVDLVDLAIEIPQAAADAGIRDGRLKFALEQRKRGFATTDELEVLLMQRDAARQKLELLRAIAEAELAAAKARVEYLRQVRQSGGPASGFDVHAAELRQAFLQELLRAANRDAAAPADSSSHGSRLTLRETQSVVQRADESAVTERDQQPSPPRVERHVLVYGEEGKFGGWPANHGMWMWGDEILVGFSIGEHKDLGEEYHNIDREKPEYHVLARSLDGGLTWNLEYPNDKGMLINAGGMRHGTTDPRHTEPDPVPITTPIDFTHPDFCMTMRFQTIHDGTSRLYYSYDRGHNWKGPFLVPSFGQPGIMARTDYLVNGPHDCHVLLTASKKNRREGRVFAARTTDGGVNWEFLSFVGPEPSGFAIMPSTVRLSDDHLVTAVRRRAAENEPKRRWIEVWASHDNGHHWELLGDAVADLGEGNPPSLIKLQDGRLCLTYGVRKAPYEMQAKFSRDGGRSWSEPFVLITGGGGRDMGYPRSLQRADGKIVTLYYFHPGDSPYRRIMATIWDPGEA